MTTLGARVRSIPSWQITLGIALLVLGFLVAAQLASEGPRVRYTTQERSPLVATALDLQARQETLKDQILELRRQIQETEQRGQGSAALVRELNDQLQLARIAGGLLALQGTGIVFQLEDSVQPVKAGANEADYLVTARDIRTLVEELWLAGAEAVSINGERIAQSTAIIDIGGSTLVNSAFIAPPYQVSAIGPDDLYEQVSASQGFVAFVVARADAFGIRVSFLESDAVDIPAYAGTISFRYGRVAPSASPAP
ncbi:MAG: DUF881 domain-containing protein [Chloroflexota bacterium]|nr:DUF881 domain-containing protein [Chloroflexota bacterium]